VDKNVYYALLDEIDRAIDNGREEFLNIFLDSIRYKTVNPPGDELEFAKFLTAKLAQEGAEVELQEVRPGRPNALGYIRFAQGGKKLLFNSHMDTVPAGAANWESDPFEPVIKDGLVYGRGVADDKGGLISMLIACIVLQRLKSKIGGQINGEIIFCGVMGEETGGIGTEYWVNSGRRADAAVVGEPSKMELVIAHRGAYRPSIYFYGKTAHSSEPSQGENAIYYASNFVQGIQELEQRLKNKEHYLTGYPTIALTIFNGGVKVNVIPDKVEVALDRRLSPGEKVEEAKKEIEDLLQELAAQGKIGRYEFGPCIDNKGAGIVGEDEPIVKHMQKILQRRGYDDKLVGMRATTDMYLLTDAGIPTIIFGPGDMAQAHRPNEHFPIEELFEAAKIYAELAVDFFKD